jgi:hypothetical protein
MVSVNVAEPPAKEAVAVDVLPPVPTVVKVNEEPVPAGRP